jgi:hypothetical protein
MHTERHAPDIDGEVALASDDSALVLRDAADNDVDGCDQVLRQKWLDAEVSEESRILLRKDRHTYTQRCTHSHKHTTQMFIRARRAAHVHS